MADDSLPDWVTDENHLGIFGSQAEKLAWYLENKAKDAACDHAVEYARVRIEQELAKQAGSVAEGLGMPALPSYLTDVIRYGKQASTLVPYLPLDAVVGTEQGTHIRKVVSPMAEAFDLLARFFGVK